MNVFLTIGNLKADPKRRLTKKGSPVANFLIAVPEEQRESNLRSTSKKINWFKVVAFESNARYVKNKLKKGDSVYIIGEIRNNRWKNGNEFREEKEIKVNKIGLIKKSMYHKQVEQMKYESQLLTQSPSKVIIDDNPNRIPELENLYAEKFSPSEEETEEIETEEEEETIDSDD